MNICKNCKFWDGGKNITGSCDRADQTGYERNPKPKTNQLTFEVYADAAGDTGLDVYLTTGCNFGCILFEPKS